MNVLLIHFAIFKRSILQGHFAPKRVQPYGDGQVGKIARQSMKTVEGIQRGLSAGDDGVQVQTVSRFGQGREKRISQPGAERKKTLVLVSMTTCAISCGIVRQ